MGPETAGALSMERAELNKATNPMSSSAAQCPGPDVEGRLEVGGRLEEPCAQEFQANFSAFYIDLIITAVIVMLLIRAGEVLADLLIISVFFLVFLFASILVIIYFLGHYWFLIVQKFQMKPNNTSKELL